MTGIANQYALAVFSLAKESNREEEFFTVIQGFNDNVDDKTHKFFAHPKISKIDKKSMLSGIVKDALLLNFLTVLVDNDRFLLIEAIVYAYKDILDEQNKVMQVKVFSKTPLTKDNLNKITKKLKSTYNRKVELEELTDESIIGGFRLEFEGNVLDETVNKRLDDIKASLQE
ncbi:MAG: ATP synthase F1 subunit delta [Sphaerochaetaceae bacterium]|nr:ATP synthase F1 subunit delta [Sphaerochaetaceae bacterium]